MEVNEIAEELRKRLAELVAWRETLDYEALYQGYLVVSKYGTVLGFDIDGVKAINPRPMSIQEANRFTAEQAHYIAERCYDNEGSRCHAERLYELIAKRVADANAMLADYDRSAFTQRG